MAAGANKPESAFVPVSVWHKANNMATRNTKQTEEKRLEEGQAARKWGQVSRYVAAELRATMLQQLECTNISSGRE